MLVFFAIHCLLCKSWLPKGISPSIKSYWFDSYKVGAYKKNKYARLFRNPLFTLSEPILTSHYFQFWLRTFFSFDFPLFSMFTSHFFQFWLRTFFSFDFALFSILTSHFFQFWLRTFFTILTSHFFRFWTRTFFNFDFALFSILTSHFFSILTS